MRAELAPVGLEDALRVLQFHALGDPAVRAAEKLVWRLVLLRGARRQLQRVRRYLFDAASSPATSAQSTSKALRALLRACEFRALAAHELAGARAIASMARRCS